MVCSWRTGNWFCPQDENILIPLEGVFSSKMMTVEMLVLTLTPMAKFVTNHHTKNFAKLYSDKRWILVSVTKLVQMQTSIIISTMISARKRKSTDAGVCTSAISCISVNTSNRTNYTTPKSNTPTNSQKRAPQPVPPPVERCHCDKHQCQHPSNYLPLHLKPSSYLGSWLSWQQRVKCRAISIVGIYVDVNDGPVCSVVAKQVEAINGLKRGLGHTYRTEWRVKTVDYKNRSSSSVNVVIQSVQSKDSKEKQELQHFSRRNAVCCGNGQVTIHLEEIGSHTKQCIAHLGLWVSFFNLSMD